MKFQFVFVEVWVWPSNCTINMAPCVCPFGCGRESTSNYGYSRVKHFASMVFGVGALASVGRGADTTGARS